MKLLLTSIAANIIERAIPLFPKKPQDCKIICIPTAANGEEGPKDWLHNELNVFRRLGFKLTMLDLDGVDNQTVENELQNTDIIYVSGGNTFYLLEKMKACDFGTHARKALERGAIYIGSSAGTIVCCPDIDYIRSMDNPDIAKLDDTKGLNLVDFYVMVHMDHASFSDKANEKILEMKNKSPRVFCLKDNEALFVDGQSISII